VPAWQALVAALFAVLAFGAFGATASAASSATNTTLVHQAALYAQQHHAQVAQGVAILLGFVASHVTAWLTHVKAPDKWKAGVAVVVSVIAGTVASIGWAPDQPWFDWVKAIFLAIIASHVTYALKAVTGVAATQKVGLGLGAPSATPLSTVDTSGSPAAPSTGVVSDIPAALGGDSGDSPQTGAGLISMLVLLAALVLVVVGVITLIVAAVATAPHLSVTGVVLVVVGVVLAILGRAAEGGNLRL